MAHLSLLKYFRYYVEPFKMHFAKYFICSLVL